MKQFFKFFLAAFAALILFCLIGFFVVVGIAVGGSNGKKSVGSQSVLHINTANVYGEQSSENPLAMLQGGEAMITGVHDAIRAIEHAKEDNKIKGIYLKMGVASNGWATLTELREALKDFKKTDKFIYAYGEVSNQKSYYLASVADSIFLNPHGGMEFKGLTIVGNFFKGTLDKLGVKTEAFHCGKFKGAHEPFSRKDFSGPNEFQLKEMLTDIDSLFMIAVSEKTGKSLTELKQIANTLDLKFPADAKRLGFVDGLVYADSVRSLLRNRTGLDEDKEIKFVGIGDYLPTVKKKKGKKKIAVLYANGAIVDGSEGQGVASATFTKSVRKIAKDDDIKGLVLRVNSPGGSALASEIIYRELQIVGKRIPIYVSMGNVAASGGYYLSCAADTIFADANTITGSIGVVGMMFNIGDFMRNKVGVTFDAVKTGEFSDFPNTYRDMTSQERAFIQSYLDSVYVTFKSRVAEARGMSMEEVEQLAQGHVYSGVAAKELKLVDCIGSQKDALSAMSKRLKLEEYGIVEYPSPKDPITELISQATGGDREVAIAKKYLGKDYKLLQELKQLRQQQNKILARMPYIFEIK